MKIIKYYSFVMAFVLINGLNAMEQPKELNIWQACKTGDVRRVRELIKAGVSVDSRCSEPFNQMFDCTPLMIAAAKDHLLVVMELVKAGADIHRRSECGLLRSVTHTPLGFAALWGGCNTVAALLQFGAPVNTAYYHKITYIKEAILTNKPAMCRLLVEFGADLTIRDELDLDAFGWVAAHNRAECLRNIVCSSFSLPKRNRSLVNNLTSSLSAAIAFLPYCSDIKPSTPAQRIKMLLFCFKEMGIPKDIQKLLICGAASEDMVDILANQLACNKKIPLFALNLMVDACYEATSKQLLPVLNRTFVQLPQMMAHKHEGFEKFVDTDLAIAPFLDPTNFEENYGEQLRANIRAHLANPYQYMNQLLALEDKKDGEKKK